jgi:hypothetical protein
VGTVYVVLQRVGDNGDWREVAEVEAHSVDQAIRVTVDPDGSYVAIPSRKWRHRPVAIADDDAERWLASVKVDSPHDAA